MDLTQVRVECLKLAQQLGGSAGQVVERAKIYEKYIEAEIAKGAGPFTSEPRQTGR